MAYRLTKSWLAEVNACAYYLPGVVSQFTEGQTVDRALMDKMRSNGVPVLWAGVRFATPALRRRLIARTIEIREPIVRQLIGVEIPEDRAGADELVADLLARSGREDKRSLRDAGKALRRFARDRDLGADDVDEADRSIAATLVATSYAGGSPDAAEDDLVAWLSTELGLQ